MSDSKVFFHFKMVLQEYIPHLLQNPSDEQLGAWFRAHITHLSAGKGNCPLAEKMLEEAKTFSDAGKKAANARWKGRENVGDDDFQDYIPISAESQRRHRERRELRAREVSQATSDEPHTEEDAPRAPERVKPTPEPTLDLQPDFPEECHDLIYNLRPGPITRLPLPNVRIPRRGKDGKLSKTYIQACTYIMELHKGTFHDKPWDPDWKPKDKVPKEPLDWKHLELQLKTAIEYAKRVETKWALADFLVNSADPAALKSPFVGFYSVKPVFYDPLDDYEFKDHSVMRIFRNQYDELVKEGQADEWSKEQWRVARRNLIPIVEWFEKHDEFISSRNNDWQHYIGTAARFTAWVARAIVDKADGCGYDKLTPNLVRPGTWQWDRVLNYITEYNHNITEFPKNEPIDSLCM